MAPKVATSCTVNSMKKSTKFNNKKKKKKRFRVKWKTHVNLVWGKPIGPDKKEAIAYVRGFPATFLLSDRRAFVLGSFVEKKGLFSKATNNYVYFEADLKYLKDYQLEITKSARSGFISFNSHGDIINGVIHFIKMLPEIIQPIKNILENASNIRKPYENSGIVILGKDPFKILEKRTLK
ncbi:MAG: hypothetical protein ACTSRZ_07480 [Promethearchaeota archaeon]